MTQFSDDLFLGAAVTGMGSDPALGNPSPMGVGVGPMGRIFMWDTAPATAAANNIALSQATAAAGDLVLTAGPGNTLVNGRVVLDVPRAVVVAAGTFAATTIFGFDVYGQPMSQTLAAAGTTLKAFKSISRIAVAGVVATMVVGTTDVLGIPVRITDLGYIVSVKYGSLLTQDAGTAVTADQTSPATALTGDVRGTYTPSIATNGARRVVMAIAIPAIGSGPNATRIGAIGVNQV